MTRSDFERWIESPPGGGDATNVTRNNAMLAGTRRPEPDEGLDALPEPEPDMSAWPVYAICGECDGSGYADDGKDCPLCGGVGLVEEGKEP